MTRSLDHETNFSATAVLSIEHIKIRIRRADENLKVAESNLKEGFYAACCFHA
ncbi:MAG: HEPN domain-containing protein [Nitrososphaerales archaeon]